MSEIQIRMPDLATTADEIRIVRWLVAVGSAVRLGEPLLEIETDKATMEIEAVAAGTLMAIHANADDLVAVGQVIASIEGEAASAAPAVSVPAATAPPAPVIAHPAPPAPAPAPPRPAQAKVSLSNRILVDEHPYSRDFLLYLYEKMVTCRQFEDRVKLLFLEGTMPGTIHQSQGQEATAVGVCAALNADDYITSTHRPHSHALAKGLTPEEIMLELFGKADGCCKGKGGSMHIGNMAKGMVPAIAIVGGGIPLATGMGLAFRMQEAQQVVACFFGEGASNEGAFHEGVNLAAIWSLPVIFICENNLYGASTAVSKTTRVPRISQRAESYGIRGETVDGNNVIKVYEAVRRAAEECRQGQGPVLLELLTYRRVGHSRRDPAHYQDKDEQTFWFRRDPIALLRQDIVRTEVAGEDELDAIDARVAGVIEASIAVARAAPEPTPDDLTTDVFATTLAPSTGTGGGGSTKHQSIVEALRDGIVEEMARDESIFCIGEDIGVPGGFGGAFTVTLGLEEKFRARILDTPISELGFFGAAVGAAMMGMRPIADVQYSDFLYLAMDQIANNAAKLRYMSGGTIKVPVVFRAPVGATGRGSQHAQNMERFFIGIPGLKVVAPSNAYDAKGLLKAALRDDDPVLMFEHKLLYGSKGTRAETGTTDASSEVPDGDYVVPIGTAAVRREGDDVTVLAWLLMLHESMAAASIAAEAGVSAEVIDVRSLAPIDWATIGESVRKTGRVMIVEEGPKTGGVGAELAAGIVERFADSLCAPVMRVASADVPVPFTPILENLYRPDRKRIAAAMREVAGG